jgi:HSP20 family protein
MANLPSFFRSGSFWSGGSPFRELNRMQRQIDRLFNDMIGGEEIAGALEQAAFTPPVDVHEADKHYILSFDVPGVKKEDLHIELSGNELCVWGERKQEHKERSKSQYRTERSYGAFSRAFTLPEGIGAEQIQSDFRDGVLHVAIPKVEPVEERAQQIQIGGGAPGLFQRLLGHGKSESTTSAEGQRPGMETGAERKGEKREKGGRVA